MKAKVIQVIVTDLGVIGKGVLGDPVRRITQYWTLDGQLLAEVDPNEMMTRNLSDAASSLAKQPDSGGEGGES